MSSSNLPLEELTVRLKSTIGAVTLQICPFWPTDPQIWFAQVEVQFNTHDISSERTKVNHIVASLMPEYTQEVCNLILSPLPSAPHTTCTAASEHKEISNSCSTLKICVTTSRHNSCIECSSYWVKRLTQLTTPSFKSCFYNASQLMLG